MIACYKGIVTIVKRRKSGEQQIISHLILTTVATLFTLYIFLKNTLIFNKLIIQGEINNYNEIFKGLF